MSSSNLENLNEICKTNIIESLKDRTLPNLETEINSLADKGQNFLDNHETIKNRLCEIMTTISDRNTNRLNDIETKNESNKPGFDYDFSIDENIDMSFLPYTKSNDIYKVNFGQSIINEGLSEEDIKKYNKNLEKTIQVYKKTFVIYNDYFHSLNRDYTNFQKSYIIFKSLEIVPSETKNFYVPNNGLSCFKALNYIKTVKNFTKNKEAYLNNLESITDIELKNFLKNLSPNVASSILLSNFKFPNRKSVVMSNRLVLAGLEGLIKQKKYMQARGDVRELVSIDSNFVTDCIKEYWGLQKLDDYFIRDLMDEIMVPQNNIIDQLASTNLTLNFRQGNGISNLMINGKGGNFSNEVEYNDEDDSDEEGEDFVETGNGKRKRRNSKLSRRKKLRKLKINVRRATGKNIDSDSSSSSDDEGLDIMSSSSSSSSDDEEYKPVLQPDSKKTTPQTLINLSDNTTLTNLSKLGVKPNEDNLKYNDNNIEKLVNFKKLFIGFDDNEADKTLKNFFKPFGAFISASSLSIDENFNFDFDEIDGIKNPGEFIRGITNFNQIYELMDIFLSEVRMKDTFDTEYLEKFIFNDLLKSLLVISNIVEKDRFKQEAEDNDKTNENITDNNNFDYDDGEISLKKIIEANKDILFPWEISFRDVAVFIQLLKVINRGKTKGNLEISDLLFGYVLNSLLLQPHYILLTVYIYGKFERYLKDLSDRNSLNLNLTIPSMLISNLREEYDNNISMLICSYIFIKISDFLYAMTSKQLIKKDKISSEMLKKEIATKTGRLYIENVNTFSYTLSYIIRYIENFQNAISPSLFSVNNMDVDYMFYSLMEVNLWSKLILNKSTLSDIFTSKCERWTNSNRVIFGAIYVIIKKLVTSNPKKLKNIVNIEEANSINDEDRLNLGMGQGVYKNYEDDDNDKIKCYLNVNKCKLGTQTDINHFSNKHKNVFSLFCDLYCLDSKQFKFYVIPNINIIRGDSNFNLVEMSLLPLPNNLTINKSYLKNFFKPSVKGNENNYKQQQDILNLDILFTTVDNPHYLTTKLFPIDPKEILKQIELVDLKRIFINLNDFDKSVISQNLVVKVNEDLLVKCIKSFRKNEEYKLIPINLKKILSKSNINNLVDWFFIQVDVENMPELLLNEPIKQLSNPNVSIQNYLDGLRNLNEDVSKDIYKSIYISLPIEVIDKVDPQFVFDKSIVEITESPEVFFFNENDSEDIVNSGKGNEANCDLCPTLQILTGGARKKIKDNCESGYMSFPGIEYNDIELKKEFKNGIEPLVISLSDPYIGLKTKQESDNHRYYKNANDDYDRFDDKDLEEIKNRIGTEYFDSLNIDDNNDDSYKKDSRGQVISTINQNILVIHKMSMNFLDLCKKLDFTFTKYYDNYYETLMFTSLINASMSHFIAENNYKFYIFDNNVPVYLQELLNMEEGGFTIRLGILKQNLLDNNHPVSIFFHKNFITRIFKIKLIQALNKVVNVDTANAFIFKPVSLSKSFNSFYIYIFILYVYHIVNRDPAIVSNF